MVAHTGGIYDEQHCICPGDHLTIPLKHCGILPFRMTRPSGSRHDQMPYLPSLLNLLGLFLPASPPAGKGLGSATLAAAVAPAAASVIFGADRAEEGALTLVRDPLQAIIAAQSGIENVIAFLTSTISAQQFEQLASLIDEKCCDSVELF
jgi:hypothetical protein